jgi:hypothetical protein
MPHLGEKGTDLNADIAALVKKGLPATIQKALDLVRVIGNEAVHPGSMDLRDDTATAIALFGLVNMIIQNQITHPKEIDSLYGSLPTAKVDGIKKRDAEKK